MTTILRFILAFLSLFFQFYSAHATLFLAGKRPPRRKKKQPAGSKPATNPGQKKKRRRKRNRRSKTSAKNLPRISRQDATFIMRSEQMSDTLKMVQSSLVAQSITGRLTCPVPDGNGKRVLVCPVVTSFPLNGNSDTGEPSMIDSNGHLALTIKPSLTNTILARQAGKAGTAEAFVSTQPILDSTHTYSSQSGKHQVITGSSSSYTSIINVNTGKADVMIDGSSKRVFWAPNLSSTSTTNVINANVTISAGTNTLNVDEAHSGYEIHTGDILAFQVGAVSSLSNWQIGFYDLTADAEIGTVTGSTGIAKTGNCVVGTTTGFVNGNRVVPFIYQSTSNLLVNSMVLQYTVAASATDAVTIAFDMEAASDPLWVSTLKKGRITSFCVWLENTSNPTKVAGQLAGFWLNPDEAAGFSAGTPGSLIAQASSLTRDTKVVPWQKGFYTFNRIHNSQLVFQPTLEIDTGYRLIIGGLPTFEEKTDVQGFLHVFMTVEAECESKVLKAPISPDSPNAIALWKTAMSEIPNNCMENAAHQGILSSIMKGVRGIANIPWVKDALSSMGNAALSSLASSAYNAIPQSMPTVTYQQDFQRRQSQYYGQPYNYYP